MAHPMKGPNKRKFENLEPVLQAHKATVTWWTKSTGEVVNSDGQLFVFHTQEELLKWLGKKVEQVEKKEQQS